MLSSKDRIMRTINRQEVDRIPIDDRITFFSRFGRWLDMILGGGWSIILIWSIYSLWTRNPKPKAQEV